MDYLQVDNYIIKVPISEILYRLQAELANGKLHDIKINYNANDIAVTCPNDEHAGGQEHSPDCHINISGDSKLPYGYFHCFACDAKGSFIKFVSLCFSSSEDFAKNWLITNYGELAFNKIDIGDDISIQDNDIPIKHKNNNLYLLDSYQSWHPYLGKRKLSKEICELFKVKYDPESRQVIFPCFDTSGNILMLPKRSIDSKIFYLDSNTEKPVYCLDFIIKNNIQTAIITEGPFDCLTAYQYGFPAIATLGNLSDEQITQINKSNLKTLYIMFDNDAGGAKFTTKLLNRLSKRIFTHIVKIPAGKKDINDLSYEEF